MRSLSIPTSLLIAAIFLVGCNRDRRDFDAASAQDSVHAYEDYLEKHADGDFLLQAQERINEKRDDQAWNEAKAKSTLEALEGYGRAYPSGRHVRECASLKQIVLESIERHRQLTNALAANTIRSEASAAWERFSAFSDSSHLESANVAPDVAKIRGSLENLAMRLKMEQADPSLRDGKSDETIQQELKDVSSRLYEFATNVDTVETLERVAGLTNYFVLTKEQEGELRLQLLTAYYHKALKSGVSDDWLAFLNKCKNRPVHAGASWMQTELDEMAWQMIPKAKAEEELWLAQEIQRDATSALCEKYMGSYPKGTNLSQVLTSYEPILAAAAQTNEDQGICQHYEDIFPAGPHFKEVEAHYEQLVFETAAKADWYKDFESYLQRFPGGSNAAKARDRLAFLTANKATVATECPTNVVRDGDLRWAWKTVFKETGGKIAFRVTGRGQLFDKDGHRWGTPISGEGGPVEDITRPSLTVSPSGSASDDYWCRGNQFLDGYMSFTWEGEDAGGHALSFNFKVSLK